MTAHGACASSCTAVLEFAGVSHVCILSNDRDTQDATTRTKRLFFLVSIPLAARLLLLILHNLNIILRHLLPIHLHQPIEDFLTHISLDGDLLRPRRGLGHRRARRELLPQLLSHLLILEPVRFQPRDHRDVFALVALHAFDLDFGRGFALRLALVFQRGFGFFFGGVFGGAFADGDGQGG